MHVAGVRFTTLFILTHIKRFFIVFRTNCWTDVVVVRSPAGRGGNMLPSRKYRAKGILAELLFAWVIQSMRAIYALLGTKECPGVPAGKEHP